MEMSFVCKIVIENREKKIRKYKNALDNFRDKNTRKTKYVDDYGIDHQQNNSLSFLFRKIPLNFIKIQQNIKSFSQIQFPSRENISKIIVTYQIQSTIKCKYL